MAMTNKHYKYVKLQSQRPQHNDRQIEDWRSTLIVIWLEDVRKFQFADPSMQDSLTDTHQAVQKQWKLYHQDSGRC